MAQPITHCPDPDVWLADIGANWREDAAGCWLWTGVLNRDGYGKFRPTINGTRRTTSAHRAAWLALRGDIPAGLVVDHLCRNRACINPDHMELVTSGVNTRRGNTGAHNLPAFPKLPAEGRRGCGKHGTADGSVYMRRNGGSEWRCYICIRPKAAALARQRRARLSAKSE